MNRKKIYLLCAFVLIFAFLGCAAWIVKYFWDSYRDGEELEELRAEYIQETQGRADGMETAENAAGSGENASDAHRESPESGQADPGEGQGETGAGAETAESGQCFDAQGEGGRTYPGLEGYDVPEKAIDFAGLQEDKCEDIYAWLTVPGTDVDYPVVQHPEDPSYYLRRDLDGSYATHGCIYTEYYNSKDWDDPNTVLYGHNMRNGTMFATLHNYEDPVFFEEHPYVYIYSPGMTRVYRVFAAYEYTNVHLLLGFDMWDEEVFEEYLESIFDEDGLNNNFNTGIELNSSDKIVTLETCVYGKSEKRYLVQAVLEAEGVQHEEDGDREE